MKKLLLVALLLALALCVGGVGANLIDDIIAFVSPQPTELTEDGQTTITSQSIGENELSVTYHNTLDNPNGTTIQLYCTDSRGYFIPVWGGSVVGTDGTFSFSKEDALIPTTNGCSFGIDYGGEIL